MSKCKWYSKNTSWFCCCLCSFSKGPHFAAVNKNNEIIVTDFHNHSVKVLTKHYYNVLLFCLELGMPLMSSRWRYGYLICCSARHKRYLNTLLYLSPGQVFTPDGELVLKFGSNGEGNGQFNAPTGVAVDVNGNIIVADWGNSRIQVQQCFSTRMATSYSDQNTFSLCLETFPGVWRHRVLPLIYQHICGPSVWTPRSGSDFRRTCGSGWLWQSLLQSLPLPTMMDAWIEKWNRGKERWAQWAVVGVLRYNVKEGI